MSDLPNNPHNQLSNLSLVRKANAHRAAMMGLSERARVRYVQDVAENADVVFGVFPDPQSADGVGIHFIKGHECVQSGGQLEQLRVEAVPCTRVQQAVAAERALGGRNIN